MISWKEAVLWTGWFGNTNAPAKRKWQERKRSSSRAFTQMGSVRAPRSPADAWLLNKCFWSTLQQFSSICDSVFSTAAASPTSFLLQGEARSFRQNVLWGEANSSNWAGWAAHWWHCQGKDRSIGYSFEERKHLVSAKSWEHLNPVFHVRKQGNLETDSILGSLHFVGFWGSAA